jgi:pyrroloquinoline quinone (PQQ) biosynthesis protein C
MIANALRARIAVYVTEMRQSNPLFYKAEDGTLTSAIITRYLANLHHLLLQTPIYLDRARDGARALGDERLALHYEHKKGEEVGHDAWAERDLSRVAPLVAAPVSRDVIPAMWGLVAYIGDIINEDPALYLAYMLFVEHFTVTCGPEWLDLLEERCGIPRTSMTAIGNHVELDREHVEEALECIDDLVGDPRKLPQMRQALEGSIAHFERFCIEVTQPEALHDARPARDVARHVSAA